MYSEDSNGNGRTLATGLVFDVRRYSIHDGPGIRTTVFLKGCPLSCIWCHNPEGLSAQRAVMVWEDRCLGCGDCVKACPAGAVYEKEGVYRTDSSLCVLSGECVRVCPAQARNMIGEECTAGDLMRRIEPDTIFFDESGGGVTFSGGEPLMQPAFLKEVLALCRERGIHTAVDTSGHAEAAVLKEIARWTDLFLYDIKLLDPEEHRMYTGRDNRLILKNLRLLDGMEKEMIIRIPVIPGVNDDKKRIRDTALFLSGFKSVRRIDLLPFHRMSVEKYRRLRMEPRMKEAGNIPAEKIDALKEAVRSFGFEVTVGG